MELSVFASCEAALMAWCAAKVGWPSTLTRNEADPDRIHAKLSVNNNRMAELSRNKLHDVSIQNVSIAKSEWTNTTMLAWQSDLERAVAASM